MRNLAVHITVWLLAAAAALGPEVWSDVHAVPGGQWTDSWVCLWSMHFAHATVANGQWLLVVGRMKAFTAAASSCRMSGAETSSRRWSYSVSRWPTGTWITLRLALSGWAMQGLAGDVSEALRCAGGRPRLVGGVLGLRHGPGLAGGAPWDL